MGERGGLVSRSRRPWRGVRLAGVLPLLVGCAASGSGPVEFELSALPVAAVKQEQLVWCWAACAEMILRFHGIETTQEEIATRISGADDGGALKVETASRYEILCALNPDLPRGEFEALWKGIEDQVLDADRWLEGNFRLDLELDRPHAFQAAFDRLVPNKSLALEELLAGHPSVVGLRESKDVREGHAYVLFGARYSKRRAGFGGFLKGLGDAALEAGAEDVLAPDLTEEVRAAQATWNDELGKLGIEAPTKLFASADYSIHEVHLVDPWEGVRVSMPYEEFSRRVDFVITRSYAREILEAWRGLVELESK